MIWKPIKKTLCKAGLLREPSNSLECHDMSVEECFYSTPVILGNTSRISSDIDNDPCSPPRSTSCQYSDCFARPAHVAPTLVLLLMFWLIYKWSRPSAALRLTARNLEIASSASVTTRGGDPVDTYPLSRVTANVSAHQQGERENDYGNESGSEWENGSNIGSTSGRGGVNDPIVWEAGQSPGTRMSSSGGT